MKKVKVGLLPLYIKLYDDSGSDRGPSLQCMETAIEMLKSCNIDVICADVCRIRCEFDRAAQFFNEAEVDAVVTYHLAYSPSLESIDALCSLSAPIIVCDTTLTWDMSVRMDPTDIGPNHGIHGVMDMCNLLKRRGKPYIIEAGHLLHSDVVARIAGHCRAAAVAKAFRTARIGSMGGSFESMGDFLRTPEDMKHDIGADVVSFDFDSDYPKYIDLVTDKEIDDELAFDKQHFAIDVQNQTNYRAQTRMGLALRKWAAAERLDSYTVNFLAMQKDKMPFLEICKAMTNGMGYAGEGDVLTAGLVGALSDIYRDVTFTETFCPCWRNDLILLSHMGEMNMNISTYKPVIVDKPFKYTPAGDTVAAYGAMRAGKATFVNLAPMDNGNYVFTIVPVELLDLSREFGAYRTTTEGWMKTNVPLPMFLKQYGEIGGTHHSALVYDVEDWEMEAFGQMMGFKTHIIR